MLRSTPRARSTPFPARWLWIRERIESAARETQLLDDASLRKRSLSLRYRATSGEPLERLIVEGFSLVREAAARRLQMRHYPVQLLGGIAMHFGSIAVMATGEGKTLTATLPIYLAALMGRGAHLATANDYLAQRDAQQLTPMFTALGLTVGVVLAGSTHLERHRAYRCDITYTTAKEIGFDFLRDRLSRRRFGLDGAARLETMLDDARASEESQVVQRAFEFLLLDEADNILIDEARTPLIVSAIPNRAAQCETELYRWAARNVHQFREGHEYRVDESSHYPTLTGLGRRTARESPLGGSIANTPLPDLYEHVQRAIHVERQYARDRDYVVRDGKVAIIDEYTGRLAEGRQWRSGLHQAIEAREKLEISVATGEAARITVQDLCLQYRRICGMTGTVASSAGELRKIYGLRSINVPTNRPILRSEWPTIVCGTESHKWSAIVDEVQRVRGTGRPVLIGTRSIDKSERLSVALTHSGIPHVVLNARHLAREAEIIAQAGRLGQVTVATNMAGRGTDIRLDDECVRLGGLHVVCSELHDAARIDRQLVGRCGRQGDPGTFRQFLSLDDDVLQNGLGASAASRLKRHGDGSSRQLSGFDRHFQKAQKRTEQRHFQARKLLLYRERQRQTLQREMGQDHYLDTPGG